MAFLGELTPRADLVQHVLGEARHLLEAGQVDEIVADLPRRMADVQDAARVAQHHGNTGRLNSDNG